MPANLTPEYLNAESTFKQARTPEDKLIALETMLRTIPKHKGTEKMRADIKRRISKTKTSLEQKKKSGHRGPSFHIDKEGCAQCVLVGPPNSGKSSIAANFTNAPAEVANYPYTTVKSMPAMLFYGNAHIQLVDLPPISEDFMESWTPSVIRVADLVLLVVKLDDIYGLDVIIKRLENSKITLVTSLNQANYTQAVVKLPSFIVATGSDCPDAQVGLELLEEEYSDFKILPLSTKNPKDAETLGKAIFQHLDLIRIYTKAPGKEPKMNQPVIFTRGAQLLDAAREIHKDFANDLKYARVWGSGKFDGQRIQRDYTLGDGDIIEFTI